MNEMTGMTRLIGMTGMTCMIRMNRITNQDMTWMTKMTGMTGMTSMIGMKRTTRITGMTSMNTCRQIHCHVNVYIFAISIPVSPYTVQKLKELVHLCSLCKFQLFVISNKENSSN